MLHRPGAEGAVVHLELGGTCEFRVGYPVAYQDLGVLESWSPPSPPTGRGPLNKMIRSVGYCSPQSSVSARWQGSWPIGVATHLARCLVLFIGAVVVRGLAGRSPTQGQSVIGISGGAEAGQRSGTFGREVGHDHLGDLF